MKTRNYKNWVLAKTANGWVARPDHVKHWEQSATTLTRIKLAIRQIIGGRV